MGKGTNWTKPGSDKDLTQAKFPRAVCQRMSPSHFIVFDVPRGGRKIAHGSNAESAWRAAKDAD